MSVVSESADNEFEMGSRRGDLLGRKTSWLISSCCSLAYPLYYCNALLLEVVGYGGEVPVAGCGSVSSA